MEFLPSPINPRPGFQRVPGGKLRRVRKPLVLRTPPQNRAGYKHFRWVSPNRQAGKVSPGGDPCLFRKWVYGSH